MSNAAPNPPFAVFDIDGTLIRWQLYHAVADELNRRGHFDPPAYAKVREARMLWKKRENEDAFMQYERALVRLVDQTITGITRSELIDASHTVLNEYKDQVYSFTRELVRDLKDRSFILFAISASPSEIVEMLAHYYGFDDYAGSQYEVKDGYYTGKKDLLLSERKPAELQKLVSKHALSFDRSIAVGDSESDIPMLSAVQEPIAFNPTKRLYEYAHKQGWRIVVERKNVIYTLEQRDGTYVLA